MHRLCEPLPFGCCTRREPKPSQIDVSSIITQVTAPGPAHRPVVAPFRTALQAQPPPKSWKRRFRSLLCCFAPQSQGYFRPHEDVPGGRFVPPVPPRAIREQLIGPRRKEDANKRTLVLDLDETLVHSSFKPIPNPGEPPAAWKGLVAAPPALVHAHGVVTCASLLPLWLAAPAHRRCALTHPAPPLTRLPPAQTTFCQSK